MPTAGEDMAELEAWALQRDWFYRYKLPSGAHTDGPIPEITRLHDSRRQSMVAVLERRFGDQLPQIDCIDIASHEGFFSFELARRTRSVRGIDVRPDSVEAATRMARLQGLPNASFVQGDILDVRPSEFGPADFVLLYGLIYHTEEPLRMLRIAGELARDTLLVETQITGFELSGSLEWGHYKSLKPIEGWFALTADDSHREGGTTAMTLIPSTNAVIYALRNLGFRQCELIPAPVDEPEQLARGKRAVIVAHR